MPEKSVKIRIITIGALRFVRTGANHASMYIKKPVIINITGFKFSEVLCYYDSLISSVVFSCTSVATGASLPSV